MPGDFVVGLKSGDGIRQWKSFYFLYK